MVQASRLLGKVQARRLHHNGESHRLFFYKPLANGNGYWDSG